MAQPAGQYFRKVLSVGALGTEARVVCQHASRQAVLCLCGPSVSAAVPQPLLDEGGHGEDVGVMWGQRGCQGTACHGPKLPVRALIPAFHSCH